MPWSVTDVMSIRLEFVAEALGRRRSFASLCEQYGISEKTGYKWLARFRQHGPRASPIWGTGRDRVRIRRRRSSEGCWRPVGARIRPGGRASCGRCSKGSILSSCGRHQVRSRRYCITRD